MVTIEGFPPMDAALTEKHIGRVTATSHPVEKGSNPTDHARSEPEEYTVEGLFVNTPLDRGAAEERGPTEKPSSSAQLAGFAASVSDGLWALKDSHNLVTIETELRSYDSMMLVDLMMPRDPSLGEAVQFTATFRHIVVVNVQTTTLPSSASANAQKPTALAQQSKKVATPSSSTRTSALATLDDSTGKSISGGVLNAIGGQ